MNSYWRLTWRSAKAGENTTPFLFGAAVVLAAPLIASLAGRREQGFRAMTRGRALRHDGALVKRVSWRRYRKMHNSKPRPNLMMLIAICLNLSLAGVVAGAQEMTWITTNGNWGTAANWDPPNVPDTGAESALIPDGGGAYAITLDLNFAVGRIRALNPSATINLGGRQIHLEGAEGLVNHGILRTNATSQVWGHIENAPPARTIVEPGCTLYLHGPTLLNDGEILVNEQGTGDAALDIAHAVNLSGSGEILLNGDNENDRISSYYGDVLTQQAGHTIRGFGAITAPFVNHGTIAADRSGGFLRLSGNNDKTNDGLFRASNGGELQIQGTCTVANAGGTIFADGGNVLFYSNAHIAGGTLDCSGSSVFKSQNGWIQDATITGNGWVDAATGYNLYLDGTEVVNDGTIRVNDTGTGNASIDVRADLSVTGAGEILLNGDDQNDAIVAYYGHTLTQGAGHTIHGFGAITVPFVNHGTVDADRPGGYIRISGAQKWNDGLLRASGGGEIQVNNCTIQNAGGTLFADGGNVVLENQAKIVGGTIRRSGSSVLKARNGWITDGMIAEGAWVDAATGYNLYASGSQLVNDGTIRLNDTGSGDAWIDFRADLSLTGGGEILMNGDDFNDYIWSYYGHTLTQEADHTIHGKGRIFLPFTNRGTVRADSANVPLRVQTSAFNNQGVCEAAGAAQLQIHQTPLNYVARRLTGGTWIARTNSSIVLNGAPVDTANATILLDGPNSNIYRDYSASNGLANLVMIGPAGDFTIQNGRDFSTAGDLTVSRGRLSVGTGSTLIVNGHFTQTGIAEVDLGHTCINGILAASMSPVSITGGRLAGSGTIQNSVECSGGVAPGSPAGTLAINGNYTQDEQATCYIDLAGPNAGQYDRLQVSGQISLAGRLIVKSINGYVPEIGERFTILTCGSRVGSFSLETGCPGEGLQYNTYYYDDRVEIEIYGDPSSLPDPEITEDSHDGGGGIDGNGDDAALGAEGPFNARVPSRLDLSARSLAGGAELVLDLPQAAMVTLEIFDFSGRCVAVLAAGFENAGQHAYAWYGAMQSGARAASGIYFARARVAAAQRDEGVGGIVTARVLLAR